MNNKKIVSRMERVQQRREAGSVAEHFPGVAKIVISMTYSQQGIRSILRTVNFSPGSDAFFKVDCLIRDCVDGGFDLTQVINSMIRNRKATAKGELSCEGADPSSDHSSIVYEVSIQYA